MSACLITVVAGTTLLEVTHQGLWTYLSTYALERCAANEFILIYDKKFPWCCEWNKENFIYCHCSVSQQESLYLLNFYWLPWGLPQTQDVFSIFIPLRCRKRRPSVVFCATASFNKLSNPLIVPLLDTLEHSWLHHRDRGIWGHAVWGILTDINSIHRSLFHFIIIRSLRKKTIFFCKIIWNRVLGFFPFLDSCPLLQDNNG